MENRVVCLTSFRTRKKSEEAYSRNRKPLYSDYGSKDQNLADGIAELKTEINDVQKTLNPLTPRCVEVPDNVDPNRVRTQ